MSLRILLCCPYFGVERRFGGPKVYIELQEAFQRQGAQADLVGFADMLPGQYAADYWACCNAQRDHIRSVGEAYDVIEFDHAHLPFDRTDLPPGPLMVARSVLLRHHFGRIRIPASPTIRARLAWLLLGPSRRKAERQTIDRATRTCLQADAVNVSNQDDRVALIDAGIPPERIMVEPFALTAERRGEFALSNRQPAAEPVIAFVGTFDPRKGMHAFGPLLSLLARSVPGVRMRLVGTKGRVLDSAGVLACFPRRLRNRVEVVPTYAPAELPGLLDGCMAGVFPSLIEGFGFGVLEMLAAGLPVVAYRAPGPPEMLPDELLVPRGDVGRLAERLTALLGDAAYRSTWSQWARRRAEDFDWDRIARSTLADYQRRIDGRTRA